MDNYTPSMAAYLENLAGEVLGVHSSSHVFGHFVVWFEIRTRFSRVVHDCQVVLIVNVEDLKRLKLHDGHFHIVR